MTFEEALAQTMSIVGLLDVGRCRILHADRFHALLGNAQRQRPIVIIAPRGSACLAAATTAPFAAECQSFLDNVIARLGQTG